MVVEVASPDLSRHEIDDLYDAALTRGLSARVVVLTGPAHARVLPPGFYRRLARDLGANCVLVVADLSGAPLAAIDGGVHLLKVALALIDQRLLEGVPPRFEPRDHRGAGDSMTAAMAVALAHGADAEEMLRLAAAAGALNVTRHGLGTGRRAHVEGVAARVRVRSLTTRPR